MTGRAEGRPIRVSADITEQVSDSPTRAQWLTFGAAWLGWVLDAFDFTLFLLLIPAITKEFGVSMTAAAGSITLTLLIRLLGGVFAGAAADRFGRKLPLMFSLVWFSACDAALYFAPSFAFVLTLRTLFGFGMGAEWTAGSTLAMENWPKRSRGFVSGVLQGSFPVGFALAAGATYLLEPRFGWRPLFLVAALPALLALPIRYLVPESSEWQRTRDEPPRPPLWRELKSESLLGAVAWSVGVLATGFGAYYAVTSLYAPLIQKELGLGAETKSLLVTLFNVGMLAGSVATGLYAAKKSVAKAILIPSALSLLVLPLYVGRFGSLSVGAVLIGALGVGYSGVTPLMLNTLFPPHLRARATGFIYHAGAFLAAFIPTLTAALNERSGWKLSSAILVVAAVCEVGTVLLVLLAPRAARSRT